MPRHKIPRPIAKAIKKPMFSVRYLVDYLRFRKAQEDDRLPMRWSDRKACLWDRTKRTPFDRHYLYHTAWAARKLAETRPELHVDISSDLRFVALVSAFVPVRYYDYRPADLQLPDLTSDHADLLDLPFGNGSIDSLSCMHVVEHIGLGRYGDPLDPDGDLRAISELQRVVSPGGSLYFVVPVGVPRLVFNAHRIYSYEMILSRFDGFALREFALITDRKERDHIVLGPQPGRANSQSYGCGCFWFVKE